MIPTEIAVTCTGFDYIDLDRLKPLQGGLKSLTKTSYQKLRASIIEHGISFPFFVWQDEDKDCWTIDGHQRDRTLRMMRREGFIVPKVPVDYIGAKSEAEAKLKLLLVNSRHGHLDEESLYVFIQENSLEFDQLKGVLELPEFSMEKFEKGWTADGEPQPQPKPKEITCPQCGCHFET